MLPPGGTPRLYGRRDACFHPTQFALDKHRPAARKIDLKSQSAPALMGNNKCIGIAASLTTAGALLVLYFSCYGLPLRLDSRPHEEIGQAVAGEALKLLGSGGRLVLIRRDTTAFKFPAVDAQLKGFFRTLHQAGVKVAVTNVIKLDPLKLVSLPGADFLNIFRKASEADVIVSFVGPPHLPANPAAKLGDKRPHVIALCAGEAPGHIDLKRLFEEKLLHVAVTSRHTFAAAPPASNDPRAWFDYLYVIVTSSNLSELPEPAAVRP